MPITVTRVAPASTTNGARADRGATSHTTEPRSSRITVAPSRSLTKSIADAGATSMAAPSRVRCEGLVAVAMRAARPAGSTTRRSSRAPSTTIAASAVAVTATKGQRRRGRAAKVGDTGRSPASRSSAAKTPRSMRESAASPSGATGGG